MGNDLSVEAKTVIKKVLDLRKDDSNWRPVIEEFNRVVPPDFSTKKFDDRRIVDLVLTLLQTQLKDAHGDARGITNLLEASRRLLKFKGLYKTIPVGGKTSILPWIQCLQHEAPEIVEASLNVMRNFVEYTGLETKDDVKVAIESQARDLLFQSKGYQVLVDVLQRFAATQHWVIVAGTLRILTITLLNGARSTPADVVAPIVASLQKIVGPLLDLSYDPNPDICYFGILTVQAVMMHSDPKATRSIQNQALSSGCLLRHFHLSVSGERALQEQRQIGPNAKAIVLESRNLIGLLSDGHTKATETLQRCLPNHLLKHLCENHPYPKVFNFVKVRSGLTTTDATWQRYQKGTHRANWIAVFAELDKEHSLPHLIWNDTTRKELLETLHLEIVELEHQKKRNPAAEWDYEGFEPRYASVEAELQVHGYYLRMLIATLNDPKSTYEINQKDLVVLINHLYNHAVIEDKPAWKLACLRCMSALYKRYSQVLLDFEPLAYLVWLMTPKHTRPLWRDHILDFFRDLLHHQPNARRFMQADGCRHIVTYMCQVHSGPAKYLHGRHMTLEPLYAVPIKATSSGHLEPAGGGGDDDAGGVGDPNEFGPLPEPLSNGALADICIDLLKLLLSRVPRLCKSITKTTEFQYILQFLLSPDTAQAVRIMPVITQLSSGSVSAQSTLSQRGAVLFALCAIGDRTDLSIIQFLQTFHAKQADDTIEYGVSALTPFLPFPMVRYLQLQTAERFLEVFDGQADQADLIWSPALRARLLDSVRSDVRPFCDQLRERPMALYTYARPTTVVYPELADEVCCGGIYLRNLVIDPTFAVADPVFMVNGFVGAMKAGLKDADLDLLLQSQIIAVERFPDLSDCRTYPAFVELLRVLTREIRQDIDLRLVEKAADLMHRLLTLPNSLNLASCLQHDAFVGTSQSLLNTVQLESADGKTDGLLQKLLRIMHILAFANDEAFLTVHENPQVIVELVALIAGPYAQDHADIAVEAVRLFKLLAEASVTCRDLLTSGAIVNLLNLAVFFDEHGDLAKEATGALVSLSGVQNPPDLVDQDIRRVLRGLLTSGLHVRLGKPDKFAHDCRAAFYQPCLIWGNQQRKELQDYLKKQSELIGKAHTWECYAPDKFKFEFTGLNTEIQVGDVYLKLYNLQEDFVIPNEPAVFLVELVEYLKARAMSLVTDGQSAMALVCEQVSTTAASIKRLLKDSPALMNSEPKDRLVAVVNGLFDSLNPMVMHTALLVIDALAQSPASFSLTTQYAFVLHRVVNFRRKAIGEYPSLEFTLRILHNLCTKDSEVVDAFFDDGFLISIMYIFAESGKEIPQTRRQCTAIFGTLVNDPRKGEAYMEMLTHLLAPTFREHLLKGSENPNALLEFYDDDHDTPVVFWTEGCRQDLACFLKQELESILEHQREALKAGVNSPPYQWNWASIPERFSQKTLGAQLYIDGIYINAFNANPYFQVKPDRFFVKLVEALYGVFSEYESFRDDKQTEWVNRSVANLLALWEAVLNLLTNLPHLQDRCVDYLDYVFGYFHPSVDVELQLVALRVTCILATNALCAENIAKFRLVKNLLPLLGTLRDRGSIPQILSFLLDVIRRSSPVVAQIRSTGGIIMLLNVILDKTQRREDRENAAMIVSAMVQDNVYGISIADYVAFILTDKFRTIFQSRPSKFIDFVDADHTSSVDSRIWNGKTRQAITTLLKSQTDELSTAMWFWDGVSDVWDVNLLASVWDDVIVKPKSVPVSMATGGDLLPPKVDDQPLDASKVPSTAMPLPASTKPEGQ